MTEYDVTEYDDEGNAERWLDGTTEISHDEYTTAVYQVTASLEAVRTRLKVLRNEREAIRLEIKRLVGHVEILERMERIAAKDTDGQTDGFGGPTDDGLGYA